MKHKSYCPAEPGQDCPPIFSQPNGYAVELAEERLPDDAPWCVVQELAHKINANE